MILDRLLRWRILEQPLDTGTDEYEWTDRELSTDGELVGSELGEGYHLAMFDVDIRCEAVPSRSGNTHLYFDRALTWEAYVEVLNVLAKHDLIDHVWVRLAKSRKQTFLRHPEVRDEQS